MSSSSEEEEEDKRVVKKKKNESLSEHSSTPSQEENQDDKVDTLAEELETTLRVSQEAPESLKRVANWIREGHCKRILVLSGAGVSCSAGIPDFRTPGTGL